MNGCKDRKDISRILGFADESQMLEDFNDKCGGLDLANIDDEFKDNNKTFEIDIDYKNIENVRIRWHAAEAGDIISWIMN